MLPPSATLKTSKISIAGLTMKKLIFIILISLFLIFSIPKTALAQGTFGCTTSAVGKNCIVSWAETNCDSGHTTYAAFCDQCDGWSTNEERLACIAAETQCIPDGDPPPDPPPSIPECAGGLPTPGDYFKPSLCQTGAEGVLNTAIGCIPTHPLSFLLVFTQILLGLGAGIAFLLMIVGAFFVLTSQGVPERLQRGREIFTGAIIGLLTMIFSTFLLELIGVDILGLFNP